MTNRISFVSGEWYHCYCRGVDKRKIFLSRKDYERFILYMHVANGSLSVHVSNISKKKSFKELLQKSLQNEPLVEIGAFCLMPNHFHILLREAVEGGISLFMQKVLTGYTMYFNIKNERRGSLFANTFNSRHVPDDRYFRRVLSYIHLNPAELIERGWKLGQGSLGRIEGFLKSYRYSSLPTFVGIEDPVNILVSPTLLADFELPSIKEMLEDAQIYYKEQNIKV